MQGVFLTYMEFYIENTREILISFKHTLYVHILNKLCVSKIRNQLRLLIALTTTTAICPRLVFVG